MPPDGDATIFGHKWDLSKPGRGLDYQTIQESTKTPYPQYPQRHRTSVDSFKFSYLGPRLWMAHERQDLVSERTLRGILP